MEFVKKYGVIFLVSVIATVAVLKIAKSSPKAAKWLS